MFLIPKGTDLFAPALCCICELSPEEDVVDTARENQYMPPSPLTGRKYICATCIRAAALVIDMVTGAELAEAQDAAVELAEEADALRARVADLEALKIAELRALLPDAFKPVRKGKSEPVSEV